MFSLPSSFNVIAELLIDTSNVKHLFYLCKYFVKFLFYIFYFYVCIMEVFEYLKTTKDINLKELANKMWPTHNSANTYLSVKLNGSRPWTAKDEAKAAEILKELGIKLTSLSAKP